jgi:DNA-binding winged helix-turn-helix (wHTH) protein/tetratricopeptide (TPR) repeat protein
MYLLVRHLYRFGLFDLDAEQRVIRRDGTKIALPPKAFDLLLYLVQNPQRPLTKEELLQAVWPDSFVEEGNLTQNIFLLRKALATSRDDFRYIVTLPGRGYQFASAVEMVNHSPQNEPALQESPDIEPKPGAPTMHALVSDETEDAKASIPTASAGRPPILPTSSERRPRWWPAIATFLVLVLATGSLVWWKNHRAPSRIQAIVLADFDNLTADGSFDVVLKKALEIDLAQSPYLDVMSGRETGDMLQLMGRDPNVALTPDVAKEICQRDNRQVMVNGSIANLGREYLLTLEATDCISGKKLTEAKAEAASKEAVLAALDSTADRLRHNLGESAKSVGRFQVPIAQATTSSLAALKAYSIGEDMVGRLSKDETETLPVFQRAVELDPDFAMANVAIATDYNNLNEQKLAQPFYQKAFDLSGRVSEKERLYIRAHYYADSQKDLDQGIKEYRLWAETYPRDWGPWLNIAKAYTQTGQYASAVAAGEQALRLDANRAINYSVLATAYMRANRFADAKSTILRAEAIGKDSNDLHCLRFQLAFLEGDQAAMAREVASTHGKPSEWRVLIVQAFAAAAAGKYRQAEQLFHSAHGIAEHENLAESADDILLDQASVEIASGMPLAARATLSRVRKEDTDSPDFALLNAQLGNISFAQRLLAQYSATDPGTLTKYAYAPRLRAEIALQQKKPLEAIAALEPATPYELAGGLIAFAQRGEAYRRAEQLQNAEAEYRNILAHRGLNPLSPLFPLAHLWLARAEARVGDVQGSRAEYEKLFALWKDADKDLPVLLATRREYAELTALHP